MRPIPTKSRRLAVYAIFATLALDALLKDDCVPLLRCQTLVQNCPEGPTIVISTHCRTYTSSTVLRTLSTLGYHRRL